MTSDPGADAVATAPALRARRPKLDHFPQSTASAARLALIGLSTALPTVPGRSSGCIGPVQLERLAAHLGKPRPPVSFASSFSTIRRVHPSLPATSSSATVKIIAAALSPKPAPSWCCTATSTVSATRSWPDRSARCRRSAFRRPLCCPGDTPIPAGAYHLHHIRRCADKWSIETHIRTYEPAQGRFGESDRRSLTLPVQAAGPPMGPAGRASPFLEAGAAGR